MTKKIINQKNFWFFMFISWAIIFLFRFPEIYSLGYRDSGIFAYIGDMILNGQVLYRDLWEHKTPFIFFMDAGLFAMFGSHLRVLAVFEIVWMCFTAFIFYIFLRKFFDKIICGITVVLFSIYLSSPLTLSDFNFTEPYMLLCSILGVYFAFLYGRKNKGRIIFFSGLFTACSFLFRQTGMTIIAPIFFIILADGIYKKHNLKNIGYSFLLWGAGFLLPFLPLAVYFFLKGALAEAFFQMFTYNFAYSKNPFNPLYFVTMFVKAVNSAPAWSSFKLITLLAFTAAAYKLIFIIRSFKTSKLRDVLYNNRFFIMAFIWFITDWYAVAYSGFFYNHYFAQSAASIAVLSAFALNDLHKNVRKEIFLSFLIFAFFMLTPLTQNISRSLNFRTEGIKTLRAVNGFKYWGQNIDVIDHIQQNTTRDDYVYFWGAEPGFNFKTRRKSPSRYCHIYPLITKGFTKPKHIERFINDLKENEPKYIVDSCKTNFRAPCLNGKGQIPNTKILDGRLIIPAVKYINEHYVYDKTINNWDIYKVRETFKY